MPSSLLVPTSESFPEIDLSLVSVFTMKIPRLRVYFSIVIFGFSNHLLNLPLVLVVVSPHFSHSGL